LISTFGVMYLCGYSLDNLSLMALTIATGFVVDDAIVVLENVSRYREQGMPPLQAALRVVREVTFTVLSISLSLVAVFLPILLRGGWALLPRVCGHALGGDSRLLVVRDHTPMMCASC
jgi:multidrug efflux pump